MSSSIAIGKGYSGDAVASKSTNYTITDTDGYGKILVTTGSVANVTMTLPTAADNSGRILEIIKVDSGTKFVEIAPEGAENIRGSNTSIYAIQEGESIKLYCDGTGWILLGDPLRTVATFIEYSGGTPSVTTQTGTFISSITDEGTGDMTINFVSGTWSAAPYCSGVTNDDASSYAKPTVSGAVTTSAIRIRLNDAASTSRKDSDSYLTFVGYK